jgi:hypothetical protein
VLEAVAIPCHDYERCWRPVPAPDGLPFVSAEAALVWAVLLVLAVVLLVHRLLRA